MKQPSPNASRYTAVGLVLFGLVLIYFGWNGAASSANGVDLRAQFPFLISGGVGGLALVATGLTLVRTFEARRDARLIAAQIDRLTAVVERLELLQSSRDLAEANAREEGVPVSAYPPPTVPPFEAAQP